MASWTILLAIMGFGLALLGTFLVRSGVLTSVHAFAVDPQRGIAVLVLLAVALGAGFGLYAWRAPKLAQHTQGNEAHTAWFAHAYYDVDEHAVEINGFPLFHVAGSMVYGLSTLLAGGEVPLPTLLGMRNADFVKAYWRCVERHRVTVLDERCGQPADGAFRFGIDQLPLGE